VERIPLSETRNYVQRVIENLAVYQARFEDAGTAMAKNGARAVTQETNAAPAGAAVPSQ
jgi:soluble lytic murein transglycosylase